MNENDVHDLGFGLVVDFGRLVADDRKRYERAKGLEVEREDDFMYMVRNPANGHRYHVYAGGDGMRCGCPAYEFGGQTECKHMIAVERYLWRRKYLDEALDDE